MIEEVRKQVYELLDKDNSGHGMDHINRVLRLSLEFAKNEKADSDIVSLIALLHDVDDYKLFGIEHAKNLTNARKIMDNAFVNEEIQEKVLSEVGRIGYSKLLKGFRPQTIEGQIVSDADMCDALGANGILRVYTYSMKNNKPFFDKNIFPIENISAEQYTKKVADTSVCHLFEKVLKLKGLMLTDSGRKEAQKRHQTIVEFLNSLFREEDTPEWSNYLEQYLKEEYHTTN